MGSVTRGENFRLPNPSPPSKQVLFTYILSHHGVAMGRGRGKKREGGENAIGLL